jgi:CRP/FNR family transcriptional regulator
MDTIDATKEFELFFKQFPTRTYKKNEVLIRDDDNPLGIFCLTKGYVRQYSISKAGLEFTIHILKPIQYFPKIWALSSVPNIYMFEASTEVQVIRAPKEQLIDFIKDKPHLLFELINRLMVNYTETLSRIENLVFTDAYRRVISILLYIAKHFGENKRDGIVVSHYFTQQDIANLVGVARETASNEISKLEKKNLMKYIDHTMVLENIQKLENELHHS